jgi:hypothetical protein
MASSAYMTVLFRDIARSLNHDAVAARRKLDRVFTKKKTR